MIAGTASTTYQGKDTTIDTFTPMEECEKDDFIIFGINGMATQDENQNKCPHDQQQESCPWYFVDGESRLALIDSNPDTFDVVELTSSQLIMELTRPNSSGIPVVSRHTYKNIN